MIAKLPKSGTVIPKMGTIALILGTLLAGCQNAYDFRQEVAPVAVADLKQAHELAVAGNDPVAAECFALLVQAAEKWQAYPMAAGVASGYERARLARRFLESETLKATCGPLVDDSTSALTGLLRRFAMVP